MDVILRPHQEEAIETMWGAIKGQINTLMVCPCSFGKSLVLAKLAQRILEKDPSYRVLFLVDREILVSQLRDGITTYFPEMVGHIGIVCSSVTDNFCHERRITIASRQSLVKRLSDIEPVHAVLADECHMYAVPREKEEPDQFGFILNAMRDKNKHTRLIGCTATPYRLTDGFIYGSHNKPGSLPYWEDIDYECKVETLLEGGYLAPLVGKTVVEERFSLDLSRVGMVGGDYNLGQLDALMTKDVYLQGAINAWKEHASDRNKTAMFCVSIEHAEAAAQAFRAQGIPAIAIHSKLGRIGGFSAMESLKSGECKVYTSVGKLTTGMDVPDIDALILARPTKSTALFKQIIGRAQRIFPGKTDAFILDLVGLTNEFGTNLDRLKVIVPKSADDNLEKEKSAKKCPICQTELEINSIECPECGYIYEVLLQEANAKELRDIEWAKKQAPVEMGIVNVYAEVFLSKKSGKQLLRIVFTGDDNHWNPTRASAWLCFPNDGYSQGACKRGRSIWNGLFPSVPTPQSAEHAIQFKDNLVCPVSIVVDKNGEYPDIMKINYGDK